MAQTQTGYLSVQEAADRLGMTPDGVYKLIQRGKLDVERVSARKTKVPEDALNRYMQAQQARVQRFRDDAPVADVEALRQQFADATGRSPEDWLAAWKRDEIEDTPESMRLLVRAVALVGSDEKAPISDPDAHPWARAAFAPLRKLS